MCVYKKTIKNQLHVHTCTGTYALGSFTDAGMRSLPSRQQNFALRHTKSHVCYPLWLPSLTRLTLQKKKSNQQRAIASQTAKSHLLASVHLAFLMRFGASLWDQKQIIPSCRDIFIFHQTEHKHRSSVPPHPTAVPDPGPALGPTPVPTTGLDPFLASNKNATLKN